VRKLIAKGPVPFKAFPGVITLVQRGSLQPTVYSKLTQGCSQLRSLQILIAPKHCWYPSLTYGGNRRHVRVTAVRGITALQHLTELHFSASDDAEVAPLAGLRNLRKLRLLVLGPSKVSVEGLESLAGMMESPGCDLMSLEMDVSDWQLGRQVKQWIKQRVPQGIDVTLRR
jgi:hypothetical protein